MDRMEIVNILGQKVQQINLDSNREILVNSSEMDKGIYFVCCYKNSKLISKQKLIK